MNQKAVLSLLNLEHYSLSKENLKWIDERTLIVRRWNWDYSLSHAFQRDGIKLLQDFPRLRILICCSHPHVFTMGRGLQKPRKGEVLNLVDFDPAQATLLPFPLHKIERGGGLTFHHPGQFIFYPLVKLNPKTLILSRMIDDMFAFSSTILNRWGMKDLSTENQLLGLWQGNKKLASMGVAIEKLTTFHGMALNLIHDEKMMSVLRLINPCGLSGETYTSASQTIQLPDSALDKFADAFLQEVQHGWQ